MILTVRTLGMKVHDHRLDPLHSKCFESVVSYHFHSNDFDHQLNVR